jgi:hypothetical protein
MLVAIIAVVVFVFARLDLAAFPSWFMAVTAEAITVSWSIARNTCGPWMGRIFAIADAPLRISPAMAAVWATRRIDMPRRC